MEKGAQYVNAEHSLQCEGVPTQGMQIVFNSSLKLNNQKRPKVTCLNVIKFEHLKCLTPKYPPKIKYY